MKKLTKSPLVTLLITLSALTVSATAYAGSTTGAPKLKEDGTSDLWLIPPTGGSTLKATAPDAAKPEARTAARPSIKVLADRRRYSNHCSLVDTSGQTIFRVPMATRWWWVNKVADDVKFCVVAGAIKRDTSATQSYQLNVAAANGANVPMAPAGSGGGLSVGGTFNSNSSLWSDMGTGGRMATSEFCSSDTVKLSEVSERKLKLIGANGAGACRLHFADTPWVDLRAQIVPKNLPMQPQ